MKKSLLLLFIYWMSLFNKATAETRKFFYEPGSDIHYDNTKPYQKNSRWNSSSTLMLSAQLTVSDRQKLFDSISSELGSKTFH
jgi:hypothetical protein